MCFNAHAASPATWGGSKGGLSHWPQMKFFGECKWRSRMKI